jgi:hypothetical protein
MFGASFRVRTLSLLMLLLLGGVVFTFAKMYYYQVYVGAELRKDLGFQAGTPYISEGGFLGMGIEPVTIEEIVPGSVFDKAGFVKNDILIDGIRLNKLYQTLERSRGGEPITFTVVSWDDERPISQRPRRKVTVVVPQ